MYVQILVIQYCEICRGAHERAYLCEYLCVSSYLYAYTIFPHISVMCVCAYITLGRTLHAYTRIQIYVHRVISSWFTYFYMHISITFICVDVYCSYTYTCSLFLYMFIPISTACLYSSYGGCMLIPYVHMTVYVLCDY